MVAASVNARPDLFGAAILDCGIYDLLQVSEANDTSDQDIRVVDIAVVKALQREFGNVQDSAAVFTEVSTLSPLHNIPFTDSTEKSSCQINYLNPLTADDKLAWSFVLVLSYIIKYAVQYLRIPPESACYYLHYLSLVSRAEVVPEDEESISDGNDKDSECSSDESVLVRVEKALEAEQMANTVTFTENELIKVKQLNLLTIKPMYKLPLL